MEETLFIIKPGFSDRYYYVINTFLLEGLHFTILATGSFGINRWEQHYIDHADKPFYHDLCEEMANKPIYVMIVSGENVITRVRQMVGATDPTKADPKSFRGQFGKSVRHNGFHSSDSIESAKREIALWTTV